MRKGIQADKRKDSKELFFINDFATPLSYEEEERREALELVRLAPSATNSQPWRIVKKDNKYHFYLKHSKGYDTEKGDIQKVDMGIALYHFMALEKGNVILDNPSIPCEEGIEYLFTVTF